MQITWKGNTNASEYNVFWDLWNEYKGQNWPKPAEWLDAWYTLRESIRSTSRGEKLLFGSGACTKGRVSETKGHLVLIGKIIKHLEGRV